MRLLLGSALLAVSTSAYGQEIWTHNESLVQLEQSEAAVRFIYVEPKVGLPVKKGAVLLTGTKSGDAISGMAYRFSSKCGPIDYQVRGTIAPDKETITLSGNYAVWDANCNRIEQGNEVLVFKVHQNFYYIVPGAPRAALLCQTSAGSCSLETAVQPGADCWCPLPGGKRAGGYASD